MVCHIEEVLEEGVLIRVLGPKKEELTGGLKELPNAEVHCSNCTSPNIMKVIKSGKVLCAGNVPRRTVKSYAKARADKSMARGLHCSPNTDTFFPTNVSILRIICVYIHTTASVV